MYVAAADGFHEAAFVTSDAESNEAPKQVVIHAHAPTTKIIELFIHVLPNAKLRGLAIATTRVRLNKE
jgi:hypothetical protein